MKKLIYAAMVTALLGATSCVPTTNNNNKPNGKETEITDNTTDNNSKPDDKVQPAPDNNEGKDNKDDKSKKDDPKDDNSFKSAEGRFSINFPMPPAGPTKNSYTTKAGTIENVQYVYSKNDKASYFLSYSDYPAGAVTDANVEATLKTQAESFMKNIGSKIDKSSSERLDGNKGLSFSGKRDKLVINMRAFFVGKRYYQFGTIAEESEISTKESNKFIDSFKIK
ncbi:MAG: hypothetical protein PUC50_17555 [Bacteroidales bacterium]|nr:hypothetical protein [Bacteroidales bacterium]